MRESTKPQVLTQDKNSDQYIALFISSLQRGGAEKVVANLARSFCSQGHKVDLILGQEIGPFLENLPENIRIINLNANHQYKTLPGLIKYFRQYSPDILITALPLASFFSLVALKIAHRKLILISSVHTLKGINKKIKDIIIQYLDIIAYKKSDYIVAVSKGVSSQLIRDFKIPAEKVHVINNPVLPENYHDLMNEPVTHPYFTQNIPIIVSAGRLEREKGFIDLINAIYKVNQSIDIRLIILGEGSERKLLEGHIRKLGLSEIVSMPGHVNNPMAYMFHAKVFALPSYKESFSNVIIEALTCGCSVVSTDCPCGPREILQNGNFGALVEVGNSHNLALAITKALKSPKTYVPEEYLAKFLSTNVAKRYLSFI